jgi:hypothetical protein
MRHLQPYKSRSVQFRQVNQVSWCQATIVTDNKRSEVLEALIDKQLYGMVSDVVLAFRWDKLYWSWETLVEVCCFEWSIPQSSHQW